jgi:hypothetical protein
MVISGDVAIKGSSFRELMGYPRLSPVDETATAFGSR